MYIIIMATAAIKAATFVAPVVAESETYQETIRPKAIGWYGYYVAAFPFITPFPPLIILSLGLIIVFTLILTLIFGVPWYYSIIIAYFLQILVVAQIVTKYADIMLKWGLGI